MKYSFSADIRSLHTHIIPYIKYTVWRIFPNQYFVLLLIICYTIMQILTQSYRRSFIVDELREISKEFLYLPLETCEFSPVIVIHPYLNSGITFIDGKPVNLLEDEDALDAYLKKIEAVIEQAKTPYELMMLLQSQYAMSWLKFARPYLDNKDFSRLFGEAWVNCETANMDVNVPVKEAAEWFRSSEKSCLMTEDEYIKYLSIPDVITLYRGVAKGRVEKGMSWTSLKSKAKWFSGRFGGEGYLLKMTVPKNKVLAYFNRRDEEEYVVYPENYERI